MNETGQAAIPMSPFQHPLEHEVSEATGATLVVAPERYSPRSLHRGEQA